MISEAVEIYFESNFEWCLGLERLVFVTYLLRIHSTDVAHTCVLRGTLRERFVFIRSYVAPKLCVFTIGYLSEGFAYSQ